MRFINIVCCIFIQFIYFVQFEAFPSAYHECSKSEIAKKIDNTKAIFLKLIDNNEIDKNFIGSRDSIPMCTPGTSYSKFLLFSDTITHFFKDKIIEEDATIVDLLGTDTTPDENVINENLKICLNLSDTYTKFSENLLDKIYLGKSNLDGLSVNNFLRLLIAYGKNSKKYKDEVNFLIGRMENGINIDNKLTCKIQKLFDPIFDILQLNVKYTKLQNDINPYDGSNLFALLECLRNKINDSAELPEDAKKTFLEEIGGLTSKPAGTLYGKVIYLQEMIHFLTSGASNYPPLNYPQLYHLLADFCSDLKKMVFETNDLNSFEEIKTKFNVLHVDAPHFDVTHFDALHTAIKMIPINKLFNVQKGCCPNKNEGNAEKIINRINMKLKEIDPNHDVPKLSKLMKIFSVGRYHQQEGILGKLVTFTNAFTNSNYIFDRKLYELYSKIIGDVNESYDDGKNISICGFLNAVDKKLSKIKGGVPAFDNSLNLDDLLNEILNLIGHEDDRLVVKASLYGVMNKLFSSIAGKIVFFIEDKDEGLLNLGRQLAESKIFRPNIPDTIGGPTDSESKKTICGMLNLIEKSFNSLVQNSKFDWFDLIVKDAYLNLPEIKKILKAGIKANEGEKWGAFGKSWWAESSIFGYINNFINTLSSGGIQKFFVKQNFPVIDLNPLTLSSALGSLPTCPELKFVREKFEYLKEIFSKIGSFTTFERSLNFYKRLGWEDKDSLGTIIMNTNAKNQDDVNFLTIKISGLINECFDNLLNLVISGKGTFNFPANKCLFENAVFFLENFLHGNDKAGDEVILFGKSYDGQFINSIFGRIVSIGEIITNTMDADNCLPVYQILNEAANFNEVLYDIAYEGITAHSLKKIGQPFSKDDSLFGFLNKIKEVCLFNRFEKIFSNIQISFSGIKDNLEKNSKKGVPADFLIKTEAEFSKITDIKNCLHEIAPFLRLRQIEQLNEDISEISGIVSDLFTEINSIKYDSILGKFNKKFTIIDEYFSGDKYKSLLDSLLIKVYTAYFSIVDFSEASYKDNLDKLKTYMGYGVDSDCELSFFGKALFRVKNIISYINDNKEDIWSFLTNENMEIFSERVGNITKYLKKIASSIEGDEPDKKFKLQYVAEDIFDIENECIGLQQIFPYEGAEFKCESLIEHIEEMNNDLAEIKIVDIYNANPDVSDIKISMENIRNLRKVYLECSELSKAFSYVMSKFYGDKIVAGVFDVKKVISALSKNAVRFEFLLEDINSLIGKINESTMIYPFRRTLDILRINFDKGDSLIDELFPDDGSETMSSKLEKMKSLICGISFTISHSKKTFIELDEECLEKFILSLNKEVFSLK